MTLYDLLPEVHRRRDAESGSALRALLAVIDEAMQAVERDIEQLYDDWFVETCEEWLVPYLADLLGAPQLQPVQARDASLRAYVANTIAYRRRKGTAAVLEQLAFDVTGWRARAVEYFELLAASQHLDHLRPDRGGTVDLRATDELDRLRHGGNRRLARFQGAFDRVARTPDVRRIATRRGTHNIPSLGIWLWRLDAHPLEVQLSADPSGPNRFRVSPLGVDGPLFNLPQSETSIDELAREANVPGPIRLLALQADLIDGRPDRATRYYGAGRAIEVFDGADPIAATEIRAADLETWAPGGWNPADSASPLLLDPTTSRLMLPDRFTAPAVRVRSATAAVTDMGGGPYDRTDSTMQRAPWHRSVGKSPRALGPVDHPSISAALTEWAADVPVAASVEVVDDDRYGGVLDIALPLGARLTLRAAQGHRPILRPTGSIRVSCAGEAELILDGLLIAGAIEIDGPVTTVVRDCTLVPGHGIRADRSPLQPDRASIVVADGHDTRLTLVGTITGPVRMPPQPARVEEAAPLVIVDSIVQSPRRAAGLLPALSADDAGAIGVEAAVERSTVVGSVHVSELEATDAIFTHRVEVARTQGGCLRFSFVARGDGSGPSRTPQRYRCEPDESVAAEIELARARAGGVAFGPVQEAAVEQRVVAAVVPQFVASEYGDTGYLQLAGVTPTGIASGATSGTEMGAYASVMAPIRMQNLRRALDHYTRYGTEVGVLIQT